MTELNPTQRRKLRASAHHLRPVVSISQKGLTPPVLAEIDRSLNAHELIKIRLYGIERDTRDALLSEICTSLECANVQHIGNLLVLWRENPKPITPAEPPTKPSTAATRGARKPANKKQAAATTERRRSRNP